MSIKATIRKALGEALYSNIGARIRVSKYYAWRWTAHGADCDAWLRSLRNQHIGRRCFVIGNGPSLNRVDIGLFNNEITIGSNGIFVLEERSGFSPTYYTCEDQEVVRERADEIRKLKQSISILPQDLLPIVGKIPNAIYFRFNRYPFDNRPKFSEDILSGAYWGGTVTYLNLQLAVFLGCNPIYLVGVDHSFKATGISHLNGGRIKSEGDDNDHFDPSCYPKGSRRNDPRPDRMEKAYHAAKEFAERRGISIVNATIGGALNVFDRAELSTVFFPRETSR